MTSIPQLIAELEGRGIILFLAEGELRYRSPKDALGEADRQILRARRSEISTYLRAREAGMALRAVKGVSGPLTPSVAHEMWWRFAGGADEGKPVALNIAMATTFRDTAPQALMEAIREVIARHDTLRTSIAIRGEETLLTLNSVETFEIEVEDLGNRDAPAAEAYAKTAAQEFCARLVPIEGQWLVRAKVFILPGGGAMAALVASHAIADAASRNIVLADIEAILDRKGGVETVRPSSVPYNDYSLGERNFLASPQGAMLIDYWRQWYDAQPAMHSPRGKIPMLWGNGARQLHNFFIPKRILDRVRALAADIGATPFLVYLTIFSITLARWSGMERFALRILGDKRTSLELSNTVGLMFCADAVEIHVPPDQGFAAVLRGILTEYDASLARRIPTLHFYAPQCVRPGIEEPGFPNRIPAVFNYYSAGTVRERALSDAAPDPSADMPWPPDITRMPLQTWARPSSPVFLHLMDTGPQAAASLHFYNEAVNGAEQQDFISTFFRVFAEAVPA